MSAMGDDPQFEGLGQPIGFLLIGIVLGGIALFGDYFSASSSYLRWVFLAIAVVFVLIPVLGAYATYRESGLVKAIDWVTDSESLSGSSDGSSSSTRTDKVPPPSEKTKNDLYFDRAEQKCEWCDEQIDSPDVHHIIPRSEGGTNDLKNLIVLCPSCHRRADNGAISQSKLQAKVRRQMERREV